VGPRPKGAGDAVTEGAGEPAEGARPMRADAVRNRARILEAAEAVFASEGIEAPVDAIAEKAGVGVGTLYRHFPTKEQLCEAILLERLGALARDARALAGAEDAVGAFFGFLAHVVEQAALKRDLLVAVMGAGLAFDVSSAGVKDELRAAVGELLRRAQEAGAVRPDVTADMVMALVGATCQAAAHDSCPSADLLTIVCDGLRTQPRRIAP